MALSNRNLSVNGQFYVGANSFARFAAILHHSVRMNPHLQLFKPHLEISVMISSIETVCCDLISSVSRTSHVNTSQW